MYVHIAILDGNDDVWWEMPEDMTDSVMRADTTRDYAIIGRSIQDALRTADEQAAQNADAGPTDS